MAISVLKEGVRLPGFSKTALTTVTIIAGQVVQFEPATGYVRPYNDITTLPLGFVLEGSVAPAAGPNPVGTGFDYTNYSRNGLFSVLTGVGAVIEVSNKDGMGHPFDTSAIPSPNAYVYVGANGLLTGSTTATINVVGMLMSVSGTGSAAVIRIKSLI
jgi:hypothetical protein